MASRQYKNSDEFNKTIQDAFQNMSELLSSPEENLNNRKVYRNSDGSTTISCVSTTTTYSNYSSVKPTSFIQKETEIPKETNEQIVQEFTVNKPPSQLQHSKTMSLKKIVNKTVGKTTSMADTFTTTMKKQFNKMSSSEKKTTDSEYSISDQSKAKKQYLIDFGESSSPPGTAEMVNHSKTDDLFRDLELQQGEDEDIEGELYSEIDYCEVNTQPVYQGSTRLTERINRTQNDYGEVDYRVTRQISLDNIPLKLTVKKEKLPLPPLVTKDVEELSKRVAKCSNETLYPKLPRKIADVRFTRPSSPPPLPPRPPKSELLTGNVGKVKPLPSARSMINLTDNDDAQSSINQSVKARFRNTANIGQYSGNASSSDEDLYNSVDVNYRSKIVQAQPTTVTNNEKESFLHSNLPGNKATVIPTKAIKHRTISKVRTDFNLPILTKSENSALSVKQLISRMNSPVKEERSCNSNEEDTYSPMHVRVPPSTTSKWSMSGTVKRVQSPVDLPPELSLSRNNAQIPRPLSKLAVEGTYTSSYNNGSIYSSTADTSEYTSYSSDSEFYGGTDCSDDYIEVLKKEQEVYSGENYEELKYHTVYPPLDLNDDDKPPLPSRNYDIKDKSFFKDLLDIEKSYISTLEKINGIYEEHVHTTKKEELGLIFGNIEKILKFHKSYFYNFLQKCETLRDLGKLFMKMEIYLKLYVEDKWMRSNRLLKKPNIIIPFHNWTENHMKVYEHILGELIHKEDPRQVPDLAVALNIVTAINKQCIAIDHLVDVKNFSVMEHAGYFLLKNEFIVKVNNIEKGMSVVILMEKYLICTTKEILQCYEYMPISNITITLVGKKKIVIKEKTTGLKISIRSLTGSEIIKTWHTQFLYQSFKLSKLSEK